MNTLNALNLNDWHNRIIAVVEDEDSNYLFLGSLIGRTGAQVVWFKNGEEICNYLIDANNRSFDVILMDLKMPVMDGYDALIFIRSKLPHIPVIAQTAQTQNADIKRIVAAGFDDYVVKPIQAKQLLDKIAKFLVVEN